MDGFSVLFEIFLIAVFLTFWKCYFFPRESLRRDRAETVICCSVMAVCACGVLFVLLRWSANDVRDDLGEITFYLVSALAGIGAAQIAFEFLGMSFRDDAIERRNRGALYAFGGVTIGASCCIAGANVGNGPGGEVVLLCAIVSTGALLGLWILLAKIADAAEAITVERDAGAGLRVGGFLAGCGAAFGAAVAGDWVSPDATLRDFMHFSWPVFVASIGVTVVERKLNRRPLARRLGTRTSALLATAIAMAGVAYSVWVARH